MEFKANFIGMLFIDFVYYGSYFLFFQIIFGYVDSLLEFTRADVIVFLVVTFLMDTIYMLSFAENLNRLNRQIVRGDLDFVLLKPVDSQFFVSFRYFNSYGIVSIGLLSALLTVAVQQSGREISMMHAAGFLGSFTLGVLIYYSLDFIIASLAFWFRNFTMGGWLSHEVMKFSMRPDSIYSGWLRKAMFSLVPMALISSVPARILLYGLSWNYLGGQLAVAVVFLVASRIVWVRGLKRYESASS